MSVNLNLTQAPFFLFLERCLDLEPKYIKEETPPPLDSWKLQVP